MKDKNFQIKVADLLKKVGKKDKIEFEKKISDKLPNLTEEGISWSITLQSINDESVLASLDSVDCTLNDICDNCQNEYKRKVHGEEYMVKFVSAEAYKEFEKKEDQESEEDVFPMEETGDVINAEDMVTQWIIFQEPFVKRCPTCQKEYEKENNDEMNDEDLWYFESTGNITFS